MSGTDLDQTLTCETEGQVQKAGVCALPGKKLFEIIKQLPEAEVVFESKDADRVALRRSSFSGHNPLAPFLPLLDFSSKRYLSPVFT